MRASRVEITPWHSTRGRISPLFQSLTQTPNRYPSPPPDGPSEHPPIRYPLPTFIAMSYPYSPGNSRPSANGHHNQFFAAIPFNRTEGFLAKMFGPRDAAFFIESLLKVDAREVHLVGNVPGWHNALMSQMPSIQEAGYALLAPNGQPLWLLDFIPQRMYHVVPQKIWTPPNQSDWRRYVEQATLRMPVFFIQNSGAIGLPLAQALNGDRALLRGADKPAPLGGGHSTQIRIAVSSAFFPLSSSPPNFSLPPLLRPSQLLA